MVTAIHIHHGLQREADAWDRHAGETARALGVGFRSFRVDARAQRGEGPEAAARNARYSALAKLLQAGDVLLAAHHLDDQLETVLLQLLRGAGLRGLSGMPEAMPLGPGQLLRPLLMTSKQAIDTYASAHGLTVVNDPSNACIDFDRNYLRHEVLPLLKQRWPACDRTVARAASHCAQAERLLTAVIDAGFDRIFNADDKTLSISHLLAFDRTQQQGLLRRWFSELCLKPPSTVVLGHILDQVVAADSSRQPEIMSQGRMIRRFRDKLYCVSLVQPPIKSSTKWLHEQTQIDVGENRLLSWRLSSSGIPLALWQQADIEIRFRTGGEKIALAGRTGHHSLKNLYQEAAVPPWQRDAMPLIYLDDRLAAVGDLWISALFHAESENGCVEFSFEQED